MSLYIRSRDDGYNDEPGGYNSIPAYQPGFSLAEWKQFNPKISPYDPIVPMFSQAQKKMSTTKTVTRYNKPTFDGSAAGQAKRRMAALAKQAASRAVAQQAQRYNTNAMGLQRAYRKESNYVDLANASYANDTTGSITLINTVAQGAAVTQRVGKKFFMKSLQIRGIITNNAAATSSTAVNLIVYDSKPTGSLPAITDILVSANSNSFNNDNNTDRFKIIRRYDDVLVGAPSATTGTSLSACNFDDYIKLNKPVVCKAAGTGAIGDIELGALYFVTVGNNAAGTSASATACAFRIRFADI